MRKAPALVALCAALIAALAGPAQAAPRGCDPLDPAHCLLPWPNDHFVKAGKLALRDSMMPRNDAGKVVRAADYNYSDGFSPGQTIVTVVPGLDLARSGAVPQTNLAKAYARRAPIVVIDAKTGKRQLIWAELDSQAKGRRRALLIHPGKNWREGRRYIVALRNLENKRGKTLRAHRSFRAYRDGARSGKRAAHFEGIFRRLAKSGIRRESLYLAWDFTVAGESSLSRRMLSIRNRAFAELGDTDLADLDPAGAPPPFTVTSAQDIGDVRRVDGTFTIPCFLDQAGCPVGSRFKLGSSGLPVRTPGNVQEERFICLVPEGATNGRPLIFGHGLFGTADAVLPLAPLAAAGNFVACATDWSGMSSEDVPNALALSEDLSRFPTLTDRTQQGFLNFLFLGRLMIHPQGLASNSEFAGKIDTPEALLRRREPGRDPRRRADGDRPGLRALGADRARHELQPAAHALDPVHPLPRRALRQLLRPDRARPARLDDPDALGPRRGQRLRLAHDARPAARHPAPHGAAARGLRRPPGGQRGDRGRGAGDRRAAAHARARPGPQPRPAPLLRDQADAELPMERQRAGGVRHRPAAWQPGHACRRPPPTCRPRSASTRTPSRASSCRRRRRSPSS